MKNNHNDITLTLILKEIGQAVRTDKGMRFIQVWTVVAVALNHYIFTIEKMPTIAHVLLATMETLVVMLLLLHATANSLIESQKGLIESAEDLIESLESRHDHMVELASRSHQDEAVGMRH